MPLLLWQMSELARSHTTQNYDAADHNYNILFNFHASAFTPLKQTQEKPCLQDTLHKLEVTPKICCCCNKQGRTAIHNIQHCILSAYMRI